MSSIAILVNPMSGRDVRRLAARASYATNEAKMDMVARIAAGADAMGVDAIHVTKEPFRIASRALEWMPLQAHVHVSEFPISNTEQDTSTAVELFLEKGVRTIVSLGGDGTHRIITKTSSDVDVVPLSTGTNNVFPLQVEPTIAGMVAGWAARGCLDDPSLKRRSKVLHIDTPDGSTDLALIDVVLLANDVVGNMLPFDPKKIRAMALSRAVAGGIGMTSIGGLLHEVGDSDDLGLFLKLGSGIEFRAPLSPGMFKEVAVSSINRLELGEIRSIEGPGVLALDGDRLYSLKSEEQVSVTLRRDGPFVYDVDACMSFAVANGLAHSLHSEASS